VNSYTLNPGEAAFFRNPWLTNLTFTFVGQVPQGQNSVVMQPGYNMVSSPVPQAGGITSVLGLEPTGIQNYNQSYDQGGAGDVVSVYNNPGGYSSQVEDDYSGNPGGNNFSGVGGTSPIPWDTEPSPLVGQGFWYRVQPNAVTLTWTRTFSVNN
jgi:hypothetical protein